MPASPLFGRFDYPGMSPLLSRLAQLGPLEFSGYLVTRDNRKFYGLDVEEVRACEQQYRPELAALSLSASKTEGAVVRISIRFQGPLGQAAGQYLISTGSRSRNHYWQQLLLGHAAPAPEPGSLEEGSTESPELQTALPYIPPLPARPKPVPPYRPRAFRQPTLSLTDHFYFDRDATSDTLINLLNRLSDTFLGGASFHLRLETSDGDFHLKVDRHELRYLFSYRREKLLMLYMDAGSLDGQWINLRLSYHPLAMGPNAEIDLTSHRTEDILAVVYDMIGAEPPASQWPARLNETYCFSPAAFDLAQLTRLIEELSRYYLHRIPALAFLASQAGSSYTGLSLYQLRQLFPRYQDEVECLSVGVTQVTTGQNLSLMFRFPVQDQPARVSLSMMWGDERKHEAVKALVVERLALRPPGQREGAVRQDPAAPSAARLLCLVSLQGEGKAVETLWEAVATGVEGGGGKALRLGGARAHQQWEQEMEAMHAAAVLIADLRFLSPEVMYRIGMARALGKRIILLTKGAVPLPPPFRDLSYVRLDLQAASNEQLIKELSGMLRRWWQA